MGMLGQVCWVLLALLGVLGCGLFAGLETGVYSLNRVRLYVLSHESDSRAAVMSDLLSHPARLLASLLIATNVATNIATSAVAVVLDAQGLSEWQVIVFDVLMMTPVFFIFAETLPKDLFAAHADNLVYPFARPLRVISLVFYWTGLVPLLTGLSALLMRLLGATHVQPFGPRYLVRSLLKEGVGHGLLSDDQSAMVERVLVMGGQKVAEVMQPWEAVTRVDVDVPSSRLWEMAEKTSRSRYPVVDQKGKVLGLVDINDVLMYEPQQIPPVVDLMQPALTLEEHTPVRQALSQLRSGSPMAIVTEQDRPVGIVTLKDLIEPITGELASW